MATAKPQWQKATQQKRTVPLPYIRDWVPALRNTKLSHHDGAQRVLKEVVVKDSKANAYP